MEGRLGSVTGVTIDFGYFSLFNCRGCWTVFDFCRSIRRIGIDHFFGATCAWGGTWKKVSGIIHRNEKNMAGVNCFRKQLNLPSGVPESAVLSFRKAC